MINISRDISKQFGKRWPKTRTPPSLFDLKRVLEGLTKRKGDFCSDRAFIRDRFMTFLNTAWTLISFKGGCLSNEILGIFGSKRGKTGITPSGIVRARKKIPSAFFREVFRKGNEISDDGEIPLWHGLDVILCDGTDNATGPDEEVSDEERSGKKGGKKRKRKHHLVHVTVFQRATTKIILDAVIQGEGEKDEIGALLEMLEKNGLERGKACIVADRAFFSHYVITAIEDAGFYYCIRVKSDATSEIEDLPDKELDEDLSYPIVTSHKEEEMDAIESLGAKFINPKMGRGWPFGNGRIVSMRVLKAEDKDKRRKKREESKKKKKKKKKKKGRKKSEEIKTEWTAVVTNLPRDRFPFHLIFELYRMRWGVETAIGHLKDALSMESFHARLPDLIKQEIWATLIMYNALIRSIIWINKKRDISHGKKGKAVKWEYEIDFVHAARVILDFIRGNFKGDIIENITDYIHPIRPGRSPKRNVRTKYFKGNNHRGP